MGLWKAIRCGWDELWSPYVERLLFFVLSFVSNINAAVRELGMEEDGEGFWNFVLGVIVMISKERDGKFSGTYLYCSCSGIQGGQISLRGGERNILCQVVFSFLKF